MTSPILRLSVDVWSLVADFLDFESVLNLISIGNAQVSTTVGRSVRRVWWLPSGPVLDFESFLRVIHRLGAIQEVDMNDNAISTAIKKPVEPLIFPPTLTSLFMRSDCVFDLISGLDLASQLPQLRSLSFMGAGSPYFQLEDISIPPKLETLLLRHWATLNPIKAAWISSLPRSLTSLSVKAVWDSTIPKNDNQIPPILWPPSLAKLELPDYYTGVLEHLPRTLTSLAIQPVDSTTQFPTTGRMVFPWRRFFPRLHTLQIPYFGYELFDVDLLLRTILVADALGASEVDTFMASGFWGVPSLSHIEHPTNEPYPPFQLIGLPTTTTSEIGNDIEELSSLLPYLTHTNVDEFCGPSKAIALLHATKTVQLEDTTDEERDIFSTFRFPPSVTNVFGQTVRASSFTPQLLTINSIHLLGSGEHSEFVPGDVFPPKLSTLSTLFRIPDNALSVTPVSLTALTMPIYHRSEWELIAERLVNLTQLDARLQAEWPDSFIDNDGPLLPFASTCLETVMIDYNDQENPAGTPKLKEILSEPIFPPSLTSLSLDTGCWHVSLLALLPRNLKAFSVDSFVWEMDQSSMLTPYPEAAGMSHEDLIKSLPSRLSTFSIFSAVDGDPRPKFEILRFLPRTIVSLKMPDIFDVTDRDNHEYQGNLPPYLTNGTIEGLFCYQNAESAQRFRPPGFLN